MPLLLTRFPSITLFRVAVPHKVIPWSAKLTTRSRQKPKRQLALGLKKHRIGEAPLSLSQLLQPLQAQLRLTAP